MLRTLVTVAGAAGILLATATAAGAHVTVDKSQAPAGSYQQLTFSVPHGCDGSSTTAIAVRMPDGTDSVTPEAPAGWSVAVADRVVTWQGGPLPDHQLQRFTVSVKLPDQPDKRVFFPIVQTCETGQTDWITEWDGKGEEPERPAPALMLTTASDSEGGGHHDDAGSDDPGLQAEPISDASDGGSSSTLAAVALVVGGLGLATGVAALVAARRRS